MIYEKMTNEDLKKEIANIENILKLREREDIQNAQKKIRELIDEYEAKGIYFYINDGYGGKTSCYSRDIYAEKNIF